MGNLFSSEGGCCDRLGKTSEEENVVGGEGISIHAVGNICELILVAGEAFYAYDELEKAPDRLEKLIGNWNCYG